ncbi:hypothetical protein BA6E_124368 [Bacteroidales bacterium 6E]|nr:hypothetical protein BA6E_124368 [Bacteroidales bacterium 6E]
MENLMNLIETIHQEVRILEREFQQNKGQILTEDDLKCHLFMKLYRLFGDPNESMDSEIKISPLHAEVSFFDENGKLSMRPDLAIINPKNTSILHSVETHVTTMDIRYKHLSGKEFEFHGDSIIFELKFCRSKKGISKRHIESYQKDIDKIQSLQTLERGYDNKIIGIFIVFNMTDIKSPAFFELLKRTNESLYIFYGTGDLEWQDNRNYLFQFKNHDTQLGYD